MLGARTDASKLFIFLFSLAGFVEAVFARAKALPKGMTNQQAKLLVLLERVGAVRLSELAEHQAVTQGTMTSAIQKLTAKGWVFKTRDPKDARALSLTLSPKGKMLASRITQEATQMLDAVLADLGPLRRGKLEGELGAALAVMGPRWREFKAREKMSF